MKKTILFIWLTLLAVGGYAQQVYTSSNINLRSESSTNSKVIYQIPKGTLIELDGCESDWCEVTVSGHSGFIAKQYTVSAESYHSQKYQQVARPIGPVNYYTNSKGTVVQSPTHYNKPPEGATAQCRDGSYSFSQNHRGTCSHHGGVAKWLQ